MEAKVLVLVAFVFIGSLESGSAQQAYQKKALDVINQYRAKHHAPALKTDTQLNDVAVKCAQYYVEEEKIDHTCPHKTNVGVVGENLYSARGMIDQDQTVERSVGGWYDQGKSYDYNNDGYTYETGHFTQVVWNGSQKLGFGSASNDGYTVNVAIFSPPGNHQGQFKENVLKP